MSMCWSLQIRLDQYGEWTVWDIQRHGLDPSELQTLLVPSSDMALGIVDQGSCYAYLLSAFLLQLARFK